MNALAIEVHISDFTVEIIEQSPAYDWDNFLSDLGGQMGLWIGASVYSGVELVSILLKLILYHINSKRSTAKYKSFAKSIDAKYDISSC